MKSAKRQTRSREIEVEQNETNDRKRAKISPPQEVRKSREGSRNGEQSNGDSDLIPVLEHISSKFAEQKTSTPINLNGANSDLAPDFQNVFQEPIPFNTSDIRFDNEVIMEQKDFEMSIEVESTSTSSFLHQSETIQEQEGDKVLEMPKLTEEVPIVASQVEVKSTEKCDIDVFSSSLLQAYELNGHAENIVAVIAEEDMIISASQDTTIKVWDPYKKEEICNCQGHTGSVNAIVLLSSEQSATILSQMNNVSTGRVLISGSTDCYIRLWSIPDGVELKAMYTYNGITSIAYRPEQNIVAIGTDGGKLELWDLVSSKMLHSAFAHDGAVSDVKMDGTYIYTASCDGKVKVWHLDDDDELQSIYCRNRKNATLDGKMTPSEWKCIAAHDGVMYLGDNTSDIKLLDWKAGRLRMMRNQIQPDGVTDAIFARKNTLLSSSFDPHKFVGAINVWQLPSLSYICTMSGEVGKISSMALTEVGNDILRVVSGGSKLIVWDYHSSKPPAPEPDDKYFCREIESLGEDMSLKSVEQSTLSANTSEVDGRRSGWNRCIIF